jgi:hypothetical protein
VVRLLVRRHHCKLVSISSIPIEVLCLNVAIHLRKHAWWVENLGGWVRVRVAVAVHLHVHAAIDILLLKVEVRGRLWSWKVVVMLAGKMVMVNL